MTQSTRSHRQTCGCKKGAPQQQRVWRMSPLHTQAGSGRKIVYHFQYLPVRPPLLLLSACRPPSPTRSLALECGVEFDDKGTSLFDHFAHQAAGGATDSTVVATSHFVQSKAIFGSSQPQVCFIWGVFHLVQGGGAVWAKQGRGGVRRAD